MDGLLLAMPPPGVFLILELGAALAVTALIVLGARISSRREAKSANAGNPAAGLAVLALILGPLLGGSSAALFNYLDEVSPLDVKFNFVTHTSIGCIAGLIACVALLSHGFFSDRTADEPKPRPRPPDPIWDRDLDNPS